MELWLSTKSQPPSYHGSRLTHGWLSCFFIRICWRWKMIEPVSIAYNMDCMNYMRTLDDGAFDLAVVDPPYGSGFSGGGTDIASAAGSTNTSSSTDRGNLGGEVRQKNHSVGHCPGGQLFQRAVPCLTPSNHLGRELFQSASNPLFSCMEEAANTAGRI